MCWQIAIPLLASAGGAALQHTANANLARDQERIAAEGILKQAAANREADARVQQTVKQIASSNPDEERAQTRATYLDALRKSLGTRAGAISTGGNVSQRFAADASKATADSEAEAQQNADLTAAVEAPTYQRMNEGVDINNANVDLGLIRERAAGQDYLTRLRLAMAKPNSGLLAAGQLLSGAGGALAAGGGYSFGDTPDVFGTVGTPAKAYGSVRRARVPVTPLEGVNA